MPYQYNILPAFLSIYKNCLHLQKNIEAYKIWKNNII